MEVKLKGFGPSGENAELKLMEADQPYLIKIVISRDDCFAEEIQVPREDLLRILPVFRSDEL